MKQLIHLSTIYAGLSIAVKGISFVAIILIAKYFTPEEYAIFALLFSIHQGVANFSIAGINESVIGFLKDAKTQKNKDVLFSNVLVASIPSTIIIFILSLIIYHFYLAQKNPELHFFFFFLTILSGGLLSYTIFNSKIFRLKENHFGSILYLFVPQLLFFIVGTSSIFLSNNINYFFIGSFLSISSFLMILKITYKELNLPFTVGRYSKKIMFNSLPYYSIAVLGWLGGYGNNFIINIFLTNYDIAAYTFIFTLSGILLLISNSLNQVWAPKFYNNFSVIDHNLLEKKNNFFYGLLNIIIGITVGIIVLLYPIVLNKLEGNLLAYSNMQLELFLLLISFVIYTPIWHYRIHYYVRSLGNELMKIGLYSSATGLISTIYFIKTYGSLGVYLGFFSLNVINLICIVIFSQKTWNIKINWPCFLIGILISSITFLLIELTSSFYAFLFLLICIILTVGFFNKNRNLVT